MKRTQINYFMLRIYYSLQFSPEEFAAIKGFGVAVLRFVAAYLLLDGVYVISTAVLKGVGDTRFIMWNIGLISLFGMSLSIYIGIEVYGMGLYYAWGCTVFFISQPAGVTF